METQTQQLKSNPPITYEEILLLFKETRELLSNSSIETNEKFKDTDLRIKELGKQIGGLGNKFGKYNEGLFMPSLISIIENNFKCHAHSVNYIFNDNGNSLEIDLLGISDNYIFIIEIKSNLKEYDLDQLKKTIENFKKYALEYKEKKIIGAVAATEYNSQIKNRVIENGYYFISTSDDIAKLNIPEGFTPKEW